MIIKQEKTVTAKPAVSNASSIEIKAPKVVEYIMIQGRYCVPKTLCDSIKKQVESIIPALIRNVNYTLEELCGEEYWNQLTVGARKLAGRAMAHLVSTKSLPLNFGPTTGANAKTYCLK
jgi:hypothetical protein